MSAYTAANPYVAHAVIQHNDAVVVAAFQAAYPGGREGLSPVSAATLYGAGGPAGPYTGLPWIFVDYLPFGLNTAVANGTFVDAVGDTAYYVWVTFMVLAGPGVPINPSPEAIMQRRFICGFELPQAGEVSGAFLVQANMVSRGSSRTPEGYGLAWRDRAQIIVMPLTTLTGGGASTFRGSWERMYWHPMRFPTAPPVTWRCRNTGNNESGAAIVITPGGQILIYNVDAASTFTLIATSSIGLSLFVWKKIDLVVEFSSGSGGRFRLWVNGAVAVDVTVAPASGGLGLTGFHASSELFNTGSGDGIELDVDDWINAEVPLLFTGLDWISGSHVTTVRPTAYEASHSANWTGDYRVLIQNPPFRANAEITSATSGARLAVSTDAQQLANRGAQQSGVAAMAVGVYSSTNDVADGQVGYSIAGGADVFVSALETSGHNWHSILYRPSGMITPNNIHPLQLLYLKGADAGNASVKMLMATVEYLGAWGTVDQPAGVVALPDVGVHNAPYSTPDGLFGGIGAPPYGQVTIQAGTYVGNGTGQDINISAPAHWYYVRRLDTPFGGARWWSSMIGTHPGTNQPKQIECDLMVQAWIDDAGQAKLRIAGSNSKANGSGLTYQYVLFSDPGMRFLLNGAFFHSQNLASALNNLIDETFYAEAGFFFNEGVSDQGGVGGGSWYKGKGHAADRASLLTVAETAAVLTFGLGTLMSQTPIHIGDESVAYSLWRLKDGPGGPGGPGTTGCDPTNPNPGCAVAITSYTGDGAASRDIAVALCNRFPLCAYVVPHNASSWLRDPSHTGLDSTSTQMNGVGTTQIIGGGVNKITVGIDLNTTGIIYDVFVLPGGTTGSGGWATNGTYYPVTIGVPCGPQWPPAPPAPSTPGSGGSACPDNFTRDA